MEDQPLSVKQPRILKRAGNILTSNGKVIKELQDISDTPQISSSNANGFGASIVRKFQQFMNRSKSFSGNATPSAGGGGQPSGGTRHARSASDVSSPMSGKTFAQKDKFRRASVQPCLPSIASVSEVVQPDFMASPESEIPSSRAIGNILVPHLLQQGTPMTKVSLKKHKKFVYRLDADLGQIVWVSKKLKLIPIENIKEIRSGEDARYYREQFQLSQDDQDRWLTIIYLLDGNYKTLHLIAATKDVFRMWDRTLRDMFAIRQELMRGLGNGEIRQALWEKQYWTGADEERDHKLTFEDVEKLCRQLNINSDREDLLRLFKQADKKKCNSLDFEDFRGLMKLLKARPEIDRLYKALRAHNEGIFDFGVFEKFMRDKQHSSLTVDELNNIFKKHSATSSETTNVMTVESFTAFLLSQDNSVFADQNRDIWQDMTRPLSEYYISSSHNTYLVGHQLVGDSTIEGYIRALLHSCRSVELDIYDGDQEPMIYHGKTLTSKVSLREVCQTIAKYGFVASPYPIIISAEIHCSVPQQDMIAEIMISVFGDNLSRMPPERPPKIEKLPSPEDLKGKILLKAKNLQFTKSDPLEGEGSIAYFTEPSSSTSDSEVLLETINELPMDPDTRNHVQSDFPVKDQLLKARTTILQRVRNVGKRNTVPQTALVLSSSQSSSLPPLSSNFPATSPVSPAAPPLKIPLPMTRTALAARRLSDIERPKTKMSQLLLSLLVYTVGVKFRGINKKEEYAPEHVFSLSENTANKMLRFGMWDLIKHTKTHLVRTYPKGTRVSSTNYLPHRYWAAGAQLVSINYQTFDMGYMINHAMFQRNGRSGYVLKPEAIRYAQKEQIAKRSKYSLNITVISAQQLPHPKDASGYEVAEKAIVDPYVEVAVFVPEWPIIRENSKGKEKDLEHENMASTSASGSSSTNGRANPNHPSALGTTSTPGRVLTSRTSVVKKNGFNPVWEEKLQIPFECAGDMTDLVFVRFVVKQEDKESDEPLAVYCASLGSLQPGYRHLPLHDSQLSQYLFSTLFVRINITNITPPASP